MIEEHPPSKERLVPWGEYAKNKVLRITSYPFIVLAGMFGVVGMYFTPVVGLLYLVVALLHDARLVPQGIVTTSALTLLFYGMFRAAGRVAEGVAKLEEVELLTPQAVQQLPTEETLVRASSEPAQAQEKVLLRAATGAEETPPEQLLRADIAQTP
jgi:hypothetical protein